MSTTTSTKPSAESRASDVVALGTPGPDVAQISRRALIWRRFRSHRMAVVGSVILLLLIAYVISGSLIFTEDYANDTNLRNRWQPPSAEHPFGTDSVGRDVLARTIYGGQISLAIAALSVTVTSLIGTLLGLLAGYFGGWIDSLVMRTAEALMSIPLLFLLLVLSRTFSESLPDFRVFGRELSGSVVVMILIIGFTGWMQLARIVRANTLSIKQRGYVLAARGLGAGSLRVMIQHVLPNTAAPVIVFATLGVSAAILLESYVSFLGFGVLPPTASWGNMLQRSVERIDSAPWLWFFPGILTLLTVISVNFIGDGLRDALDPESQR
ncbi:MAG: ABC transporter permease [Chloroflexi bacterium]|nr:ABC transporter permease [Chloroflexota bacterium]